MPADAIMIQGTMSGAGKSLLAAGLCRIFREDGYRVAPFKSQNMALNSFITSDGLEMGRAQAVQAEAAGTEPSVLMNPILLKPTTDMGSQVIVLGKPVGNMEAREYFRRKKSYLPLIREAYGKLASEYDLIVIEGAGSPAEINLKADDIVNMGIAEMADAKVLLAGDIDRGGVFAQLYGTCALLTEQERARIAGLIINKFRGDASLLEGGLRTLRDLTGKPVLGVVPYMDVHIEEEDSLAPMLASGIGDASEAGLDIAVVRFPKISNFTDFQAFYEEADTSVRFVSSPQELGMPDAVILPGTKSTIRDLLWMRSSGLEDAVRSVVRRGSFLFGICGGYQMLGRRISDPEDAEGGGAVRGMGVLPEETVFYREKTMRQYSGLSDFPVPELSGHRVSGYEVHMGRTVRSEVPDREAYEGAGIPAGSAAGTYLHGIFDEADFRSAFLSYLAGRKQTVRASCGAQGAAAFREEQYRILSETLRRHLDLERICSLCGIRKKR